jgi:HEAT repeat protein
VRLAAVDGLARVGPDGVGLLVRELKNKSARARAGVATALGRMGPVAKAALPELVRASKEEKDPAARQAAAEAVAKVRPKE